MLQLDIDTVDLHSDALETAVIEEFMKHNLDAYQMVSEVLNEDVFFNLHVRNTFTVIKSMFLSGCYCIDPLSVVDELQRQGRFGLSYDELLSMVQRSIPIYALEGYVNKLIEFKKKRDIYNSLVLSLKDVFENANTADASTISAKVENNILNASCEEREFMVDAGPVALELVKKIRNCQIAEPVSTGFNVLDEKLNGGLRPSTLNIIGARPGVGKSALATNIICNMLKADAKAKPMIIFSLEMGRDQVMQRILSSLGNVSVANLERMQVSGDQWTRMIRGLSAIVSHKDSNQPRLLLCDKPNLTIDDLALYCNSAARKYKGLACIMVDYVQLMPVDVKTQTRASAIGEISRQLKEISRRYEIPVIGLCQLKRESDNSKEDPKASDIKDSGNIEQDADLILMLHKKDKTRPQDITCHIVKNRNGAADTSVSLYFNGKACRFEDSDNSDNPYGV